MTTIRGKLWPRRWMRLVTALGMGGLTAYHVHRQLFYLPFVVIYALGSTVFVLRILRPLGPIWDIIHGEDDPDCCNDMRSTGSKPVRL